jgi:quinol monooxygenase YgiN
MRHTMVTYTVKPGREEENAALVRAVFEELAQTRPTGLRYAVFYFPDARQFIHLYTDEGSKSRVQALPSFQAFVAEAADRHEQPAAFRQPELIGDYRTRTPLSGCSPPSFRSTRSWPRSLRAAWWPSPRSPQ